MEQPIEPEEETTTYELEFTEDEAAAYGDMYTVKYSLLKDELPEDTPETVIVGYACLHVVQEVLGLVIVSLTDEPEESEQEDGKLWDPSLCSPLCSACSCWRSS